MGTLKTSNADFRNWGALDRKVLPFLGGLKGFIRYIDIFNCLGFGCCGFSWSGKSFCAPVTAKKKTEVFIQLHL